MNTPGYASPNLTSTIASAPKAHPPEHTRAHPPHQIIIGDTLTALGLQTFGPGHWFLERNFIITAVGMGVLFPLCCLRCVAGGGVSGGWRVVG